MTSSNDAEKHDTRELARKFAACPTPQLANKFLQERWHCSRSTVDRIRRAHGHRSDGPADVIHSLIYSPCLSGRASRILWQLGHWDPRMIGKSCLLHCCPLRTSNCSTGQLVVAIPKRSGGAHAQEKDLVSAWGDGGYSDRRSKSLPG